MAASYTHLTLAVQFGQPADSWLPDAYHLLATTARNRGQKKAAIEAYKKYLEIAPPGAALRKEVEKQLLMLGVSVHKTDSSDEE